MSKIWMSLAAGLVLVGLIGSPTARAAAPQPTSEDRILGKADAPITIFEYASFTCPHCADFDQNTLPKLKTDWIDTGKARLIYRDFPFDEGALKAAMLARCAPPEQFYGFVDVLFHSQKTWAVSRNVEEALGKFAKLGGMSDEAFAACMKNNSLKLQISTTEFQAQKDYGINSTPTFFINGTKVTGNLPYSEFEKALNQAMPK